MRPVGFVYWCLIRRTGMIPDVLAFSHCGAMISQGLL